MTVKILKGDCRDVLRTLPDESVHCVCTSPPYWGLRDYGVAGQIGLEGSFAGYVEIMRNVFGEVRRVLRKDGTLWLNLGDSYQNTGNAGQDWSASKVGYGGKGRVTVGGQPAKNIELKPKDLTGIPWRVAFALQADGWWLRSDIIWVKPNPMPESITDRPTSAHEHIFLLAKAERYFYDAEAIKEPMLDVSLKRLSQPNVFEQEGGPKDPKTGNRSHRKAINNQAERLVKHEKWKDRFEGWDQYDKSLGRNARNVWTIATSPFPEAHFATFPPALIEPCIKAGTSEKGCCAKCGAPWVRETERAEPSYWEQRKQHDFSGRKADGAPNDNFKSISKGRADNSGVGYSSNITLGWSQSCSCDAAAVPCTVLDPFGGAGTTGLVADRLGRNAILIELNPEYAEMADRRLRQDAGMFADVR